MASFKFSLSCILAEQHKQCSMDVKCLMTASLAILACHPKTTIRCFSPKSVDIFQEKAQHPLPTENVPSKSNKKSTNFAACCTDTDAVILPKPPHPIRTCNVSGAVQELSIGDPSAQILEKIFRSGWPRDAVLKIEKVLKLTHSAEVTHSFEEFRERVKSLRTMNGEKIGRLMADGNEFQGFIGAIITCSLGDNGIFDTCENQCCGVCRIICSIQKVGKRPITFYENTRIAHQRVTKEGAGKLKNARTAILICRVIAGRIAYSRKREVQDREHAGFDSVVQTNGDLLVLNQRAYLPCFVVIYKASDS